MEAEDIVAEVAEVEAVIDDAVELSSEDQAEAEALQQDTERVARAGGWRPKDKYSKDPATWVDAKTFVRRGEAYSKNMQEKMDKLEKEVVELKGTRAQFAEFYEGLLEQRAGEYKATLSALVSSRNAAIRESDDEEAQLIEDQIEALKAAKPVKKDSAPLGRLSDEQMNRNQAELRAWVAKGNTWFVADAELGAYALKISEELRGAGDTTMHQEFLDKVAVRVRKDFPEKFDTVRAGVNRTSQGDLTVGNSAKGKGSKDLPQADRELMQLFVKQGLTTEEKFLKKYFNT